MRSTLVALVVLLLTGTALADGPLVGRYALFLSDDRPYHHNALAVDSAKAGVVKGTLTLDLGLGMEDRVPTPDERIHRVPFEGRMSKSGALVFEVKVGSFPGARYQFELYPTRASVPALVGVVTVQPLQSGLTTGPWKRGVWAERK